jgi:formylglycine-generating enzyme required for sulfatase activity
MYGAIRLRAVALAPVVGLATVACAATPPRISDVPPPTLVGLGGSSSGGSGSGGSSSFRVQPNCQTTGAGLTDCGASSESCCTSLEVAGGTYYRTHINDGSGPIGEADPATVSGFRMDKYLVTVGRFRQFVSAWTAGYTPPAGSGKHTYLNGGQGLANSAGLGPSEPGWVTTDNTDIAPTNANLACEASYATWTTTAGSQENLPINCVIWYEAYAFCIWDGGLLPSEAEWEYAAAGGSQDLKYPWGSTVPGTGSHYAIYDCYCPDGTGSCGGLQNIAPVGTATQGAAWWGQLDMGGDVREWNLDRYATYVNPCTDCACLSSTSARVAEGGSFDLGATVLLPPSRNGDDPAYRSRGLGFRCSRTP